MIKSKIVKKGQLYPRPPNSYYLRTIKCFIKHLSSNYEGATCNFITAIQDVFIDQLYSINWPFTKYYKQQLQVYNNHLFQERFIKHSIIYLGM